MAALVALLSLSTKVPQLLKRQLMPRTDKLTQVAKLRLTSQETNLTLLKVAIMLSQTQCLLVTSASTLAKTQYETFFQKLVESLV